MKRMLINATQEEELRMAMVDGQRLYDLNIELPSGERKKANIYKGKITRVEPSLEAAFVNYGADRHGFLPLKEISSEYFVNDVPSGSKPNIRDILKEGQDIVVQIDKEERGNKGAALTTFVSLAGRFIVLKPNKPRSGGVSRRIVGEDRDLARESLGDVNIPDGMSVILRTAGIDRGAEELEWDLNNLLAIWEAIKSVVVARPSPFLIYRESNAIVRALRDYLTNEIGEILVDDEATYKEAQEFVEQVMPHNQRKLKHYVDPVPLFTRYQIESQIESAFAHTVHLPSGGSIVIDHTEALVAIDINSARATKGADIEETAVHTNLEAAEEVGRQLRLRDLGGLVVIDFIDMGPQKNQRAVETKLRDAVRQDRARVQFGKISRFGLLEMSRQRLRPSLGESSYLVCPRCTGIGNIRSVESLALAILRLIGEEARKERTAKVIAQLPVEVATYLLNEKREWVQSLESRHEMQVILVANPLLETPHYQVRRVRDDQLDLPENIGTSFALVESEEEQVIPQAIQGRAPTELAAVATSAATTPPPIRKAAAKAKSGLWAWFTGLFLSEEKESSKKKRSAGRRPQKKRGGRTSGGQGTRRRSGSQDGDGRKSPRKKQAAKKTTDKTEGRGSKRKSQSKSSTRRDSAQQKESNTPAPAVAQDGDEAKNETRKTGSKRRSRGGRRRRRSPDSGEAVNQPNQEQQDSATTESKASKNKEQQQTATNESKLPANGEVANTSGGPDRAKDIASKPERAAKENVPAVQANKEDSNSAPAQANSGNVDDKGASKPATSPVEQAAKYEKPAEAVTASSNVQPQTGNANPQDTQPSAPVTSPPKEAKKEDQTESRAASVQDKKPASRGEDSTDSKPRSKPRRKRVAKNSSHKEETPNQSDSDKKPTPKKDESSTPSAGNGNVAAMPTVEQKTAPATNVKKPEGRLLPWAEDAAPAQKEPAADKDVSK